MGDAKSVNRDAFIKDAGGEDVVATIDGRPITASALRMEMMSQGVGAALEIDELAEKRRVLESVVRIDALAAVARAAGYDQRPDVAADINKLLADVYWRDRAEEMIREISVSDDEVRQYYDAHRSEYRQKERARGLVIMLRYPAGVDGVETTRAHADAILKKVGRGVTDEQRHSVLLEAARYESDDPRLRERSGDTGWLTANADVYYVPVPVVESLFRLEVGNTTSVETTRGIYIVHLVSHEPERVKPLEEASAEIRRQVQAQKRLQVDDEIYAPIRARVDVRVNDAALAHVGPERPPSSGATPPMFPVERVAR